MFVYLLISRPENCEMFGQVVAHVLELLSVHQIYFPNLEVSRSKMAAAAAPPPSAAEFFPRSPDFEGITWPDYLVIVGYFGIIIVVGLIVRRILKTTPDPNKSCLSNIIVCFSSSSLSYNNFLSFLKFVKCLTISDKF